jgi:hypothetical protein
VRVRIAGVEHQFVEGHADDGYSAVLRRLGTLFQCETKP